MRLGTEMDFHEEWKRSLVYDIKEDLAAAYHCVHREISTNKARLVKIFRGHLSISHGPQP